MIGGRRATGSASTTGLMVGAPIGGDGVAALQVCAAAVAAVAGGCACCVPPVRSVVVAAAAGGGDGGEDGVGTLSSASRARRRLKGTWWCATASRMRLFLSHLL